jgi:5-formyltetrahydrofolate cyclo-ligase
VTKDDVRREVRGRLAAFSAEERAAAEAEIARRVWQVPQVAGARVLMLYASLPGEVGTDMIAGEATRRGITLVYPRCLEDRRLSLHVVDALDRLRPGRYGIREPDPDVCPVHEAGAVDAALIPGLAWDRAGNRLGRGAGYYDRLLADPEWRGYRCGLFFSIQEFPAIPHDPWDARMQAIVTEAELVTS